MREETRLADTWLAADEQVPWRSLLSGLECVRQLLQGSGAADQARTSTPAAAVRAGADYLVIGRPILEAKDRIAAVQRILAEMNEPQEAA